MEPQSTRRGESGQAVVEMALVSLVFLFLFFGVVEFGRALYTYNTIVHAARAAARFAVVNTADTAGKDRAKNLLVYGDPDTSSGTPILYGLQKSMVAVEFEDLDQGATGNRKVSVKVTGYQFQFVVPIADGITLPAFETSLYAESLGASS